MNSDAWRATTSPKPRKQSLSAWMAANGYRQAVVDRVASGNCEKKLLDRLKAERDTAAGPDGSLSKAQKAKYFGAASPARAGRGSRPERAGRGKEPAANHARGNSTRAGAHGAKPDKGLAEQNAALQRQVAELKRSAAKNTATAPAAGAADVPVESEDAAGWSCSNCTADHGNAKKTTCRICDKSRTTTSAPAAAPAALSSEEVAAERAKLLAYKESLAIGGYLDPAPLAAALKNIEAKLLRLDESPAEPEAKDPFTRLSEAKDAADKAKRYCEGLYVKAAGIKERLVSLQLDWIAAATAIEKAEYALTQSKAALAAAAATTAAVAAPSPQVETAPGVPSGHQAGLTQQAREQFTQTLMNDFLNTVAEELTQEATAGDKESFMKNLRTKFAAKEPQATGASAPPAVPPQAKVAPPRSAPAAAPRAAGDDAVRIAQRTTVKTASLEALDHANAIIEKAGEARRREARETLLTAGRGDVGMAGDAKASEAATA